MRLTFILLLLALATVWADVKLSEKLYQKKKPIKNGGLLEPREANIETENIDDESEEPEFFPITDSFLPDLRKTFGRTRNLFSRVWSRVFGGQDSMLDTDDSDVFGGINVDEDHFIGGFVNNLRPWWKGANVCSREEETEENATETSPGIMNSLMTSCQDMGDVYVCTMKTTRNGVLKNKKLVYECCPGWTRQRGTKGCTQSLDLKNLEETLKDENLTRFLAIANEAGLSSSLQNDNLTLFVPSNEALNSASESDELDEVVSNTEDRMQFIRKILEAHMVTGWFKQYQLNDEMVLQSMYSTQELKPSTIRINYFNTPYPFMTANCARVTSTDTRASNGMIHKMDKVIMPVTQSLWDIIENDAEFSKYRSLIPSELQKRLSDENSHLTVLAFKDDTFNNLPEELRTRIENKDACYTNLIEEHMVDYTICSAAVASQSFVRTLGGHDLNVTRERDDPARVLFEGVPVTKADKMATNGVIHIVDGVVLQRNMISSVKSLEKAGHKFAELLKENELVDKLEGSDKMTLFVPPPRALEEVSGTSEEVKEVLENHIVDNLVVLDASNDETIVETEAGQKLSINVRRNTFSFFRPNVYIGCSKILRANVKTCNGIMHFIDKVLPVASKSVLELLRSKPEFSEFVTLIEMAEIEDELDSDDFSGSVLAPTNDALKLMNKEFKESLLSKPTTKLADFIRGHILKDEVCCNMIGFGSMFGPFHNLRTLLDSSLRVRTGFGFNPSVGGADIIQCDMIATNAVVHALNRPIIHTSGTTSIFSGNRNRNRNHNRNHNRNRNSNFGSGWPIY